MINFFTIADGIKAELPANIAYFSPDQADGGDCFVRLVEGTSEPDDMSPLDSGNEIGEIRTNDSLEMIYMLVSTGDAASLDKDTQSVIDAANRNFQGVVDAGGKELDTYRLLEVKRMPAEEDESGGRRWIVMIKFSLDQNWG